MHQALAEFGRGGDGDGDGDDGHRFFFSADECAAILAAAQTPEVKDALARSTEEALQKGAYGAPWLWVTNGDEGKAEPFFGSDR